MKNALSQFLLAAAVFMASLPVAIADPFAYSAKEIRGQIVDAETKQPLEGAIVVAEWVLFQLNMGGHGGSLKTLEAVTDAEGKYVIPAWGPVMRPLGTYLLNNDPRIKVFKSNFWPRIVSNDVVSPENRNRNSERISDWDGKAIGLKAVKEGDNLNTYMSSCQLLWNPFFGCVRDCPHLVLALDAESRRIEASLSGSELRKFSGAVQIELLPKDEQEFLKGFKK